jgi:hypothetical protein
MLVYFTDIWNILRPSGIHILRPFGNLVVISYIFPSFGTLYQEKSGKPGLEPGQVYYAFVIGPHNRYLEQPDIFLSLCGTKELISLSIHFKMF